MTLLIEDLDTLLADFGVPVTANGSSGIGILDQVSDVALGGEALFIDYQLTVKTAEFGSLSYGDTVTVEGISYRVESQPLRDADGRFCRVPMVKTGAGESPGFPVDAAMLDDFGVTVTISGTTGLGILDQQSEIILGGETVIIDYTLVGLTSFVGDLSYGDTINVDGQAYKVEGQPLRLDDGALSRVLMVPSAVAAFKLLLEDSYLLLLETADALLLE